MALLPVACALFSLLQIIVFYNFQVSVNDAYCEGQKIMVQANRRLGKLLPGLPEDLCFHGYFGVSAEVAVEAGEMMDEQNCLPPAPKFLHFCGHLRSCERTQQMTRLCRLR